MILDSPIKNLFGKTNKKCGLNSPILEIEVFDYLCTQIYGIKPTPKLM